MKNNLSSFDLETFAALQLRILNRLEYLFRDSIKDIEIDFPAHTVSFSVEDTYGDSDYYEFPYEILTLDESDAKNIVTEYFKKKEEERIKASEMQREDELRLLKYLMEKYPDEMAKGGNFPTVILTPSCQEFMTMNNIY
jgi:hypothetical protein